jgi:hypothetical protein
MSTAFHLNSEDRDTVVEMINYCLMDMEGSDYGKEDLEAALDFEKRIKELADKMGLTKQEYVLFEFEKEKK